MSALIDVVVPVLGRPAAVAPLVESVRAATSVEHRLLFVASVSDTAEIVAIAAAGVEVLLVPWLPGRADFARKVNAAYAASSSPFLFQAADDVEFVPGWAEAALAAIDDGARYGVCGTNDDANPRVRAGQHSTHSLIRRAYVDECGASLDGPGSVFSEAYSHQWVDAELVELAKDRGCWTFAAGAVVRHRHPIWRTAEMDETYRKGQADARSDAELYKERSRSWTTT